MSGMCVTVIKNFFNPFQDPRMSQIPEWATTFTISIAQQFNLQGKNDGLITSGSHPKPNFKFKFDFETL